MGIAIVRRMKRFTWLRLLITLAIYLIAVPGTIPRTGGRGVGAALTADAAAVPEESATNDRAPVKTRNFADDEVRVFYCTSCGFHQNFQQVKNFLEDKYPHLTDRVYGANYDIDPMKKMVAQLLGYMQIGLMILMICGEFLFNSIGLDTTMLKKALDNRIACFAVILLLGSVSQSMLSSGAFEVYFNNDLLFSKLHTGRWPTLEELENMLNARGVNPLS